MKHYLAGMILSNTILVRDWSGQSGGVQSDGQQERPHQQPEQHGGAKQ